MERRTLKCTEVFEIPTLAAVLRSVRVVRINTVLVVRRLAVREDTLLVNGQPQPVAECGDCLCHALNLERRRRFLPEVVGICPQTAEDADAHAAAVTSICRCKHVVKFAVRDDVDFSVTVDLDVIIAPKLPVVSRRPVEIDFRLAPLRQCGLCDFLAVVHSEALPSPRQGLHQVRRETAWQR